MAPDETELERLQADPRESASLAAARLASLVGALMESAEDRSPARQKEIAEAMGVSPGRISQLLAGDGNVRISTLARFLDACGYELSLTATPKAGSDLEPITMPRPPRRRVARRAEPADTSAAAATMVVVDTTHSCVIYGTAVVSSPEHFRFTGSDMYSAPFIEEACEDLVARTARGQVKWMKR